MFEIKNGNHTFASLSSNESLVAVNHPIVPDKTTIVGKAVAVYKGGCYKRKQSRPKSTGAQIQS